MPFYPCAQGHLQNNGSPAIARSLLVIAGRFFFVLFSCLCAAAVPFFSEPTTEFVGIYPLLSPCCCVLFKLPLVDFFPPTSPPSCLPSRAPSPLPQSYFYMRYLPAAHRTLGSFLFFPPCKPIHCSTRLSRVSPRISHRSFTTFTMADRTFTLNTGAKIPALGLGMSCAFVLSLFSAVCPFPPSNTSRHLAVCPR